MPTHPQTLEPMTLFQGLGPHELQAIAALLDPLRVSEGEVLTRRDEAATTLYVILEGSYMLYFDRGRALTLHKPGDIMGGATLLAPFKHSGTAVALTPGAVLTMAGQDFQRLTRGNADLGQRILGRINAALRARAPF